MGSATPQGKQLQGLQGLGARDALLEAGAASLPPLSSESFMRPGKMLPVPQAIRPTLSPTPHPVVHLKELADEESSWNTPSMPYLQEMAGNLLKTSSLSVRTKLLHQTGLSLYNTSHGFHEEDLKKKLQQFPGGSVDLQKEDSGIGILTLNNPSKMNAFSGVMMLQLLEKVIELENWTEGKGLIVRGAKNTFSSGSDLNAVKALATPEDGMALCMFMQNTLTRLMRLMTADGEIRFVHREMGIVPSWGGGTRLVELLGARQALKVLSGALPLDAARALSLGMVEEVLRASDEASCLQEARAWLGQFTQGPPQVIRALKRSVSSSRELCLEEALQMEKELVGTVWGGPANREAIARKGKFNK
uniref:Ethylmalonyl-CoA decarboxylase 1 n=1 Tax=Canis lupus familiaris TaxID=9615 RepID=A0A8C0PRV9_CANLF